MKLRNKQTGEIEEFEDITRVFKFIGNQNTYKSLAEFIEEWEDYEEPKDFWFIDPEVLIACESTEPLLCDKKVAIETMKQIGNYFETKEEAEKAVERLRAWKRLKDKGFEFRWIDMQTGQIKYSFYLKEGQKVTRGDEDDLLLLFGGEE